MWRELQSPEGLKVWTHRASSVKIPLECIVTLQNGFSSVTIDLHGILTLDARCVHILKVYSHWQEPTSIISAYINNSPKLKNMIEFHDHFCHWRHWNDRVHVHHQYLTWWKNKMLKSKLSNLETQHIDLQLDLFKFLWKMLVKSWTCATNMHVTTFSLFSIQILKLFSSVYNVFTLVVYL